MYFPCIKKKKGDVCEYISFKGISLLSVVDKMYGRVLLRFWQKEKKYFELL